MTENLCIAPGCDREPLWKRLCRTHYDRMWRNGTLESSRAAAGGLLHWLETVALQYQSDNCLPWPFRSNVHGYGTVNYKGRMIAAHRRLCELVHGEPPSPKHQSAHSCGNRLCVNHRHLRWATVAENLGDKRNHGTDPAGERNPHAILRDSDVIEILRSEEPPRALAARYNVHPNTIYNILRGTRWRHLSRPQSQEDGHDRTK